MLEHPQIQTVSKHRDYENQISIDLPFVFCFLTRLSQLYCAKRGTQKTYSVFSFGPLSKVLLVGGGAYFRAQELCNNHDHAFMGIIQSWTEMDKLQGVFCCFIQKQAVFYQKAACPSVCHKHAGILLLYPFPTEIPH